MAAVPEQEDGWLHARLSRWAAWARCPMPGAEGTAIGYLRERLDHAHDTQPTEEIAVTDKAVAQMRVKRKDYWRVFADFYLNPGEPSEYEIARQHNYPTERVTAMLRQARFLVGHYIFRLENS
jgi:hypothetical protein